MALYYAIVGFLLVACAPILLSAKKRRAGLAQKLGLVPAYVTAALRGKSRPVWFHAVSVGEFNALWPLAAAFLEKHPACPVVISTGTQTGQNLAKQRSGDRAVVFYFPLDLPWALNNWLVAIKPCLAVIVETEIWPGFTYECKRRAIPQMVVNGRISPRSFAGYFRWRSFFGPVLRRFSVVVAQSASDAERYKAIAGEKLNVIVSGNLKFDGLKPIDPIEAQELRQCLSVERDDLVIIGGSTHEGEEHALLDAWEELVRSHKHSGQIRLILAPRHPERWEQVASVIKARGLNVRRFSRSDRFAGERDVYLLDSIGQLFRYYSLAQIAFVGGTIVPVGGHNLVEPCAYAVPVVCGPHCEKIRDVAKELTDCQALTVANDPEDLKLKLAALAGDVDRRRFLGNNGQKWLEQSQGAVSKTMAVLESVLNEQYNSAGSSTQLEVQA